MLTGDLMTDSSADSSSSSRVPEAGVPRNPGFQRSPKKRNGWHWAARLPVPTRPNLCLVPSVRLGYADFLSVLPQHPFAS